MTMTIFKKCWLWFVQGFRILGLLKMSLDYSDIEIVSL